MFFGGHPTGSQFGSFYIDSKPAAIITNYINIGGGLVYTHSGIKKGATILFKNLAGAVAPNGIECKYIPPHNNAGSIAANVYITY
jgi:hypothetical protein